MNKYAYLLINIKDLERIRREKNSLSHILGATRLL